eukprot:scaffold263086_cov37-Tisochrysis_lutea.AAC.4
MRTRREIQYDAWGGVIWLCTTAVAPRSTAWRTRVALSKTDKGIRGRVMCAGGAVSTISGGGCRIRILHTLPGARRLCAGKRPLHTGKHLIAILRTSWAVVWQVLPLLG